MTDLFRQIDPAAAYRDRESLDDTAQAQLAAILNTPRTQPRATRAWLLPAAALTGIAVVVVALLGAWSVLRPPPAVAQPVALPVLTVLSPAGETLPELARAAEARIGPVSALPVRYLSWGLNISVDETHVSSVIVVVDNQLSANPDGTTRDRRVVNSVSFPNEANRGDWDGDPTTEPGQVLSDEARDHSSDLFGGQSPPTNPAELRAFLAQGHPFDEYGPGELFVAITDLAQTRSLTGRQTAAVLRLLAATTGVRVLGKVTDRAGQPGVAVVADGDFSGLPTRYVLIFDPRTGRLNASEQWLTTFAGKLGISVPASIDYVQWRY